MRTGDVTLLRLAFTLLALCATCVAPLPLCHAAAGDLDPTFGTNGMALIDLGSMDFTRAVALQDDGKIIVSGAQFIQLGATRLLSSGALDTSFASAGVWTAASTFGVFGDALVQPDGKILLVGSYYGGDSPVSYDFAVYRLLPDGTPDASFGIGGLARADFGTTCYGYPYCTGDYAWAAALDPEGRIVVAGNVDRLGQDFGIARFDSDGSLDPSFGVGGMVSLDFAFAQDWATDVAVQADGKIVAVGRGGTGDCGNPGSRCLDFALARVMPDGSLDATFGIGGKVTTDFGGSNEEALGVVLQADGKIVVAGKSGPQTSDIRSVVLARYHPNGILDTAFGSGGRTFTKVSGTIADVAHDLVLQPDGKIVIAGASDANILAARYSSSGQLDASFGTAGIVSIPTSEGLGAWAVALQADGRLVLGGSSCALFDCPVQPLDLRIIRLLGDCGNGRRDSGEECDDGNLVEGDCCSSACRYEPPGTGCTDADGDSCTEGQCTGYGSCVGVPIACADGDGCCPSGCAASDDLECSAFNGPFAYATNGVQLAVLDVPTASLVTRVPLGDLPTWGPTTAPTGDRVYVPSNFGLTIVDASTNAVSAFAPLGALPISASASPDGSKVYVAMLYAPSTLAVVSTATRTATAFLGQGPSSVWAVAFNHAGTRAYLFENGKISVVDATNDSILGSVLSSVSAPGSVVVSPDDTLVYVLSGTSGQITISGASDLDAGIGSPLATVALGTQGFEMALTPDGSKAYVSLPEANAVAVVSTVPPVAVTATIPLTGKPRGVAVLADGSRALVAVEASPGVAGSVVFIDATTNAVVATTELPDGAKGITVAPSPAPAPECLSDAHCPPCRRCEAGRCVTGPRATCLAPLQPGKAKLRLRDAATDASDALDWRWLKGPAVALTDLGEPAGRADYTLCLFGPDDRLLLEGTARGGGTCGARPCWTGVGVAGIKYSDRSGGTTGLTTITAKSGAEGRAKVDVKGRGDALALPALPLALPATMQLQVEGGACFETVHAAAGASRNDDTEFKGTAQ